MTKEDEEKKAEPIENNICPVCGKTHDRRENLGIKATQTELDSLLLFNMRVNVARQAASPASLPPETTAEQVRVFMKATLDAQAEAMTQQRGWWQEIIAKYNLPKDKNVFVDFETGDFYVMIPQ
jgi:hypothetical protein